MDRRRVLLGREAEGERVAFGVPTEEEGDMRKAKVELTVESVRKAIDEGKPRSMTQLAHKLGYRGSVSSSLTRKFRALFPDIEVLLKGTSPPAGRLPPSRRRGSRRSSSCSGIWRATGARRALATGRLPHRQGPARPVRDHLPAPRRTLTGRRPTLDRHCAPSIDTMPPASHLTAPPFHSTCPQDRPGGLPYWVTNNGKRPSSTAGRPDSGRISWESDPVRARIFPHWAPFPGLKCVAVGGAGRAFHSGMKGLGPPRAWPGGRISIGVGNRTADGRTGVGWLPRPSPGKG